MGTKGIVITTHKSTEMYFKDLMNSLKDCEYPITIVYNTDKSNHYELTGIKTGMMLYDEFIYLHDTVIIKDQTLFDILFAQPGMISIAPRYLMYLGKYESARLKQMNLPQVNNKYEAVMMEAWLRDNFNEPCFDREFCDEYSRFEEKYGKLNMVIENAYIKKWKRTWSMSQII